MKNKKYSHPLNPHLILVCLLLLSLLALTACGVGGVNGDTEENLLNDGDKKGLVTDGTDVPSAGDLSDIWLVTEKIVEHSNNDLVGNENRYNLKIDQKSTTVLSFEDDSNAFNGLLNDKNVSFGYNIPYPLNDDYTIYINSVDLTLSTDGSTIVGTYTKDFYNNVLLATTSSATVSFSASREYKYNNTLATALETKALVQYHKNQFDDDWYKMVVADGKLRLQIDLTFTHLDGDIELELYNSDGNMIFASTTNSDNESMDLAVSLSGTYYLKVFGSEDGNKGNDYTLSWNNVSY